MAKDVESPWVDLLSDIRTHQLNLKQRLGACWDEAIVVLGLSSSKSLMSCPISSHPLPAQNLSGLLVTIKLTKSAEPWRFESICSSTGQTM